jgi:hypothetical protein
MEREGEGREREGRRERERGRDNVCKRWEINGVWLTMLDKENG